MAARLCPKFKPDVSQERDKRSMQDDQPKKENKVIDRMKALEFQKLRYVRNETTVQYQNIGTFATEFCF